MAGTLALMGLLACAPAPEPVSLNGDWAFKYDPENIGLDAGWPAELPAPIDSLPVPGFIPDPDFDGFVWYATTFRAPATAERTALVFSAIDDNVTVFLNGVAVGSHMGWGQLFWLEVTNHIQPATDNLLIVRLEDTGGPGGIIDDVQLQVFRREEEMAGTRYGKLKAQTSPGWAREMVLYEVFVRDFSPGGDFRGLEERLPQLRDLGITMLWLMPIHPIGEIKRKGRLGSPYSVQDYYGINPDFGTPEDFRRLVQAAHDLDLRLILDMVPNHSAWDNSLVTDHPEWYTHDDEGRIVSPNADWADVADFNYDQPDLQVYLQEMLAWWIREYDVDGFRIDVAELMPGEFWLKTRSFLEQVKPDVFLLAEGNQPYLHVSGFDATYAFNTFPHLIAVANGELPPVTIHQDMLAEMGGYPQGSIRMRFLENHDQLRAAKRIPHRATLEAATICAVLLPGIPLFYNGGEAAIDHRLELFDADPIDWTSGSAEFQRLVQTALALRREQPVLIHGEYEPVELPDDGMLVFIRSQSGSKVAVVINFGESEVSLDLGTADPAISSNRVIWSHRRVALAGERLTLEPWAVVLLAL